MCVYARIKSFGEAKRRSELFLIRLMKLLFIITAGENAKATLKAATRGTDLFYLGFLSHVHNRRGTLHTHPLRHYITRQSLLSGCQSGIIANKWLRVSLN